MKRALLFCGLTFLFGLSLGLFSHTWLPHSVDPTTTLPPNANTSPMTNVLPAPTTPPIPSVQDPEEPERPASDAHKLLERALTILDVLKAKDYETLSSYVHSSGVRFTPYSTVEPTQDLVLSAQQIAGAATDTQLYTWGLEDGSGAPINLTIPDYFARFVFNADYTQAPRIGVNQVIQSGNALENVAESYPGGVFVDFNFDGLDPINEGVGLVLFEVGFPSGRRNP